MHILLIEDTVDIGEAIRDYLQAVWHRVDWVQTLEESYSVLRTKHFDVAVIDWMLPDGDGIQACRDIKEYKDIPVIMATAKWQLDDKVQWYDAGADDYIVKPFDLQELDLRIRAITKRNTMDDDVIRWKNISIDTENTCVYRDDVKVDLTHKEFLIVAVLASNQWHLVSRATLMDEVRWDDAMWDGQDSKLDVYISMIRKKIWKEFIQTEKGVGYKIGI